MALETEKATFEARRADLVAEHEGEFAVVAGARVLGCWPTWEAALKAGYEAFGLEPFMVKEVLAVDRVHYFSRPL
jgi:hypothetical protein